MAEETGRGIDERDASEQEDKRSAILDVLAAVILGITTGLAAFGAYQSSLYGGNQATAYTEATNTLGEANRELLRGVQERAFDTTVWVENIKAQASEAGPAAAGGSGTGAGPAMADAADGASDTGDTSGAAGGTEAVRAPGATEPVQTKEQLAAELAAELTAVDDDSISKKLAKLQATRRDLTSALKWADEEHDKRMKALKPADRLQLATQLVELAARQEAVADQQLALVEKLGVAEGTDEEIEAAFAKDSTAQAQRAKLEADYASFDAKAEKVLDRMSKPMFFDSPAYTAQQEQTYTTLVAKGKKQFEDGQTANEIGDKFTLATVFMTVSLFFLGLSPIMRRYPMKATFLAMGTVVATGSTIFMFMHPLA